MALHHRFMQVRIGLGAIDRRLVGRPRQHRALVAQQDIQGGVITPLDNDFGHRLRHVGAPRQRLQMALILGPRHQDQVFIRQAEGAGQNLFSDLDGIIGQLAQQAPRRVRDIGHAAGQLGADFLFHLAGKLGHDVVKQRHLRRLADVCPGEKHIRDLPQQFAPPGAGRLLGQGDQIVQFGAAGHGSVARGRIAVGDVGGCGRALNIGRGGRALAGNQTRRGRGRRPGEIVGGAVGKELGRQRSGIRGSAELALDRIETRRRPIGGDGGRLRISLGRRRRRGLRADRIAGCRALSA